VHQGVTISHRGNSYAIGSGQGFYGIWVAAAQPSQPPVEWWPQTLEGWQQAWARFASIEAPGAIVAVGPPPAPPVPAAPAMADTDIATVGQPAGRVGRLIACTLLAAGVVVGVVGLFPGYLGGASLAQHADELWPHLLYLAAWAASAVLLLLPGPNRARVGALLGVGASVVTFGLYFADLGTVISSGTRIAGTGLTLTMIGWMLCATGSLLAFGLSRPGAPGRARDRESLLAVLLTAAAAIGAAIAFAPSWDSYTLSTPAGDIQSTTAGNAFANPGPVIAGDVAVMVLVVAAVVIAALWQPIRLGAALLAGATIPLVGQAVSALILVREPVSPLQFGIPPSQAREAGLTITSGLTPAFWVYCAFVLALALISARMLTNPAPEPASEGQARFVTAGAGAAPVPGSTP
jgi:hypothetical protein